MSMADDFIAVIEGKDSFTNFGAQLFRLIHKADWENIHRIAKGFPNEIELFHWWRGSPHVPSEDDIRRFCAKYDNPWDGASPPVQRTLAQPTQSMARGSDGSS